MRFLEIGEGMLSPRNEHHFLGAAIGGLFIGVYQVVAFSFVRVHLRESAFPLKMINLIYLYCRDMVSSTI